MIFIFLEKNILSSIDYHNWYSSSVLHKASKKLNRLKKQQLHPVFNAIKHQDFEPLLKLINDNELKIICGKKAKIEQSLFLAELASINFNYDKVQKTINSITPKNREERVRKIFLEAKIALHEGDMERASAKAALSINLFKKLDFIYEEASAYLLCGTIYRATAVFDTAQFMLQTAADLFSNIGAKNLEAVSLANIGMLLTAESRLDEAEDAFLKAFAVFEKNNNFNGMAEVLNQQALAALINQDDSKAQKLIKKAEKLIPTSNIKLRALNFDIAAQIAAAQNKQAKAISLAQTAATLYKKSKNVSAEQEMLYLQANALIKQNKQKKAEDILRAIIKKAKTSPSSFHIANAYNLLGIIYLKAGDFKRALSLFNQSLGRELCNERWAGAAIDYANIALIERRRKKTDEANNNFLIALKYAKEAGNEQLVSQIKEMFNCCSGQN